MIYKQNLRLSNKNTTKTGSETRVFRKEKQFLFH
jgi:hypothetical protein